MKKLKIQDLKEEKIYKFAVNGNLEDLSESIYKIDEEGDLYYKDPCVKDSFFKSNLFYNEVINGCFVEIKREIDWSKVPRGTKVQVKDRGEWEWKNSYFIKYESSKEEYPFQVNEWQDDDYTGFKTEQYSDFYKYCRIHESVAIPDEWYKEVE